MKKLMAGIPYISLTIMYHIRIVSLAFLILTNRKPFSLHFLRRMNYLNLNNPTNQAFILHMFNLLLCYITLLYILPYYS